MDIAWPEYKSLLRRAYFGDAEQCLAPRESDLCRDFWLFFDQYRRAAERKHVRCDREATSSTAAVDALDPCSSGPPPLRAYDKLMRVTHKVELDKTARYSLRQVPAYVVAEFEHAWHCYLAFGEAKKMAKLKALRNGQRALPIAAHRDEILEAVAGNAVTLIAGDTGCGKSTQVPQYLLAAGYSHVACTQPRRIACTSLARRVAHETLDEFGSRVAYAIRFERTKTAGTKLLFLTEGLLLRQMIAEPLLERYEVIILDEVHERHLHADLLVALLRMLAVQRTDMKLVLMSATINLDLFKAYFPDAPVVQVPGRLYPIQVEYRPIAQLDVMDRERSKSAKIDPEPYKRILSLVDAKFAKSERGDMLVFLPGISEITTVAETLKLYAEETQTWIILMLHSTLSLDEQDRVFDASPPGVRKCVLSTNIAETSVTIDGIRFVVDSGKTKEMRYDAGTGMHQLKEHSVSRASAEQRKGRAGRTGPGLCYRLYSKADYDQLQPYATAEIHRVSLDTVALQIYDMQLGVSPRDFPYLERPDECRLDEAIESLRDHGALQLTAVDVHKREEEGAGAEPPAVEDARVSAARAAALSSGLNVGPAPPVETLTPLGNILVNLPVDVPIGKMLVMACMFRKVESLLTLAAGLSVQSPFTNRSFRDPECCACRQHLLSDHGDPIALLNVYREWLTEKLRGGGTASRKWSQLRGIEEHRLYDVAKLRRQFHQLLNDSDLIDATAGSMGTGAEPKGSAERRIRLGEMKRLRSLKRKACNEQRKRKVLRPGEHYDTIDNSALYESTIDEEQPAVASEHVHSVEFSMQHASDEVATAIQEHRLTHRHVALVKFILCAALYPQYAVLDPHNVYKVGSDIVAHSRARPSCIVHPNSCLAQEPDAMQITVDQAGRSANHQLLFYSMLLETNKPYLVNGVRCAALHTLVLVSRRVDFAADFQSVLCDEFVEFTMDANGDGERLWSMAKQLRAMLAEAFSRKVSGDSFMSESLEKRLMAFFAVEFVYSMRRLHTSADRLSAMRRDSVRNTDRFAVVQQEDAEGHGGDKSYEQFIATKWNCPHCQDDFYSNSADRASHVTECGGGDALQHCDAEEHGDKRTVDPNAKVYYCEHCKEELHLPPVQILMHKRRHLNNT